MEKVFFNEPTTNILDPLSCIISLALLGFKQKGCKISIKNNTIIIQEPILTQGFARWCNNDIRNDIYQLCNPIEKAIEWYHGHIENIHKIFIYALKGIENLIECYNLDNIQNTTIHSLLHYKNIIEKCIENNDNILETNITLNESNDNLSKFQIFKNVWSNEDILCIILLLDNTKKSLDDEKIYYYYLDAIQNILEGKNMIKNKLIKNIINL